MIIMTTGHVRGLLLLYLLELFELYFNDECNGKNQMSYF